MVTYSTLVIHGNKHNRWQRAGLSANLGGELYNPFKNYTWDNLDQS